jgi:hypothetical protein
MTIWIDTEHTKKTTQLLTEILKQCKLGNQVQFLCGPGQGDAVVQRLRVALSRSRNRNKAKGKKIDLFTMHDSVYPYSDLQGKRHDCIVIWTSKTEQHRDRELLDDLLER